MGKSGVWVTAGLITVSLLTLIGGVGSAKAEDYIAGQVGLTVPQQSVHDVTLQGGNNNLAPGTLGPNRNLATSLLYGVKLGHYFDGPQWSWRGGQLGVETEAFTVTPNLKNQPSMAGVPDEPGRQFRVTTWAVNLLARSQQGRLQYYGGPGIGVFFAQLDGGASAGARLNVRPGLNALFGTRYMLTDHVGLFGEWKFNHSTFNFGATQSAPATTFTYDAHLFSFGMGYHF